MSTLGVFELLAGGVSAVVSLYAVGRMFYVAATAPTKVRRIVGHVGYEELEHDSPGYSAELAAEGEAIIIAAAFGSSTSKRVSLRQYMAETEQFS
jgi:hypothetical protein